MRTLLPFLITGVATGSLYGMAAVGLVLTYRTSGIFNFGHGAIAAGAAFLFYTLHATYHLPWALAASLTIIVFGLVVGWIMEHITRGLGDVPEAVVIMATVGILLAVNGFLNVRYGAQIRAFPEFLPTSGFTVAGINVSWAQVITVAVTLLSVGGLYLFLRSSRLGVAMRAVVDNPTLVTLTGDTPSKVRQSAWAIGSAFAALSGILLGPILGLDASLLTLLVVQSFGAAAIGLFQSLPLTYAGGLVVGVSASLAGKYFTDAPLNALPSAMPFLILMGALLVVPSRRFPRRQVTARSLVKETRPMTARSAAVSTLVGLSALLVVPSVVGPRLPLWIGALVAVVVFASLALLVWTSGQISLCHAAFVALGATSMSHLAGAGVPWAVALVLAGILTVPAGALVAIPAIRLSGVYLALATLGFGIFMQAVLYPTFLMFGAAAISVSAPRPQLGFIDGTNDRWFYYVVLFVAAVTLALMAAIYRGRLGRLLRALAETPTMLSTNGLGVNMTRLIVFCISAFFAGIAGALSISQTGSASGVGYGPLLSLMFLAILAICGTRLLRSAIMAAALYALLPGYLTGFGVDARTLAFGISAIGAALILVKRSELHAWLARLATTGGRVPHGAVNPTSWQWRGRRHAGIPAEAVSR